MKKLAEEAVRKESVRQEIEVKGVFATSRDALLMLMRLVLGVVFFAHGSQLATGWFGGHGFHATMGFFTKMMHIPAFFAFMAIVAEFVGGICLLIGFLSRIAAFGIAIVMLVAIFKVHLAHGFFLPAGLEYALVLLAVAILILVKGGGALSVDGAIAGEGERAR